MDDAQVEGLTSQNLNSTQELDLLSQENTFSSETPNISISESRGSHYHEKKISLDSNDFTLQKDLEFVRKHAGDVDPDLILSVLQSQMNNPKRLESLMCDILNIPNAMCLIREFRDSTLKTGNKRPIIVIDSKSENEKKVKTKDTDNLLQQMRDMFPDADGLFLINECQQLRSWEDISRFVNTVMLSGVYPKKSSMEILPGVQKSREVDLINIGDYRSLSSDSDSLSSEDVSSLDLTDTPRKRRHRKKRDSDSSETGCPDKYQHSFPAPEVDVIDLDSGNSEMYETPSNGTLQEIFDQHRPVNNGPIDVEIVSTETKSWETSLYTDIDNILRNQFGAEQRPHTPTPSTSGIKTQASSQPLPRRKSNSSYDFVEEESLSEIIEKKRNVRRNSAPSPIDIEPVAVLPIDIEPVAASPIDIEPIAASPIDIEPIAAIKPSSFQIEPEDENLHYESIRDTGSEASSPEVSTMSDFLRHESETDVGAEKDDALKVREEWFTEQTANLIRIFPNTDPSFLREEVEKMAYGSSEAINEFVVAKLEKNDMPSRALYEKKLEMEELQNRYTNNFSIEDFLKAIPDPWTYFSGSDRNCIKYKAHSLSYLKSAFRKQLVKDIISVFEKNSYNLYLSYHELKRDRGKNRTSRRSDFECNHNRPTTIDIQFLQEVAFIENEEKIKDFVEGEKIARQIKFDEAKRIGILLECQCCFDSEIMVEDIVYCPSDHAFCKNCIVRSVEVEMGYGRYKFECLANCEEKFTLACLQSALKPELFSKVIQAIQMEEIKAAGIEDLVQCPFCNYATVLPPEEKIMTCLNPECLKESCRSCKELNHIPLRCDEVEKSEEVKMRTYIENKMTEALVRTCYKCGKKFVKEDGCNKMTCTCGAKMCYVCRKPVSDYKHFNGQGGTEYHKCPLYSTNDELHVDLVKRVGEEAKAKILQENPNKKLVHDPTEIEPTRSNQAPLVGMNNGAALDLALRAVRGLDQGEANRQGHQNNRNRRERRREANPYYNRHHYHRAEREIDDDDEDYDPHNHHHREELERDDHQDDNEHHNYCYHHHQHRHRHYHYHGQYNQYRHHHHG